MNQSFTDVIIVGAGLSGLYTALNLPENLSVTLLSSYEDNSSLAQGGVATCVDPKDTFLHHITDTLKAGHYTNDLGAVAHLVQDGPEQIRQLIDLGVHFDTDEEGALSATLEGGHTNRRILHIQGDQTGKGIMTALKARLPKHKNIHALHESQLLSLIIEDGLAIGIVYSHNGSIHYLYGTHIVLATGGLGDLYTQTTNHTGAIGAGIAIAHQAGAKCANMHYIQFHPTAFYEPALGHRFLITEALRGEGAYLLDEDNNRFMNAYDQRLELAPRDVVSKAIHHVMAKQATPYVYLDTRHIDQDFLGRRFPGIAAYLKNHGFELGKDLIPVTPVAHYTIGGIVVDQQGQSSIKNLYACGEVTSSGVHGANRLASNSLLECLVYGKAIAALLSTQKQVNPRPVTGHCPQNFDDFTIGSVDQSMVSYIQQTMTNNVGILRNVDALKATETRFKKILADYSKRRYHDWSSHYIYTMVYTSLLVLQDAISNPSLGCHTLDDQKIPEELLNQAQ